MVSLSTPRITECVIEQPQDRAGRFSTEFLERYQRSEPALAELCAEGFRPARYDLIPDKGQKSGALLINVARAAIVDEDALYAALKDGHLGGAALRCLVAVPDLGRAGAAALAPSVP